MERQREDAKLGEGRGQTLNEKARRKQMCVLPREGRRKLNDISLLEARRIPAIMEHAEYKKDPWATIRLHAGNSLVMKDPK